MINGHSLGKKNQCLRTYTIFSCEHSFDEIYDGNEKRHTEYAKKILLD